MIYFDNAATTAPTGSSQMYYNPSSPHRLGITAERALRDARKKMMAILSGVHETAFARVSNLHRDDGEIVFTSGGTEANNFAIIGFALARAKQGTYLACAPYEHPSIVAPINFAAERGWGKSVFFADTSNSDSMENMLTSLADCNGHVLVLLSHVNHETGDIVDIRSTAAMIRRINPLATIHIDGAQGFCKEPINLEGIDSYSFSGHKFHGPLGVGGLWMRKGVKHMPLFHGGGQENGWRSGTENVSGIVQMSDTAESLVNTWEENRERVAQIKSVLMSLQDKLPDVTINAMGKDVSPYILNMSFLGVKGEVLVHALSERGVYVSMGAACLSRKRAKTALELMGFSSHIAGSAIRFSFSPYNTLADAEAAKKIIIEEVSRFRSMKR